MIIRIAIAAPFGLGILSSLMLIAGNGGYAAAFVSYLVMMAALVLKPPASIRRRLGIEVDDEPREEREPSEGGDGLLAKVKALPALLIALFARLRTKLPFIGKKGGEEEEEPAPTPAPAPVVAAVTPQAEPEATVAAASAPPVEAPVAVLQPAAVAVAGIEAETTMRLLMALLGRLKFWGGKSAERAQPVVLAQEVGDAEDAGAEDEATPLLVKLRAFATVLLSKLKTVRKGKVDAADVVAAVAAAADGAVSGDAVELPAAEVGMPAKVSLVNKLLAMVKGIVGKVRVRDTGTAAPVLAALAEAPDLTEMTTVTAVVDPVAAAGAAAEVEPGTLVELPDAVPPVAAVASGALVARVLAAVKSAGAKVFARGGTTAAVAPASGSASGVGRGSLLARLMPRVQAVRSKLVLATGDAAVVPAKPRRPLKESLALFVPSVKARAVGVIAWARGLRTDDFMPVVAAGWRVVGMAVLLVLALPLLAADMAVVRFGAWKAERAEARAAAGAPDPGELLLDTLVADEPLTIAA
jgi:hypothetical protein